MRPKFIRIICSLSAIMAITVLIFSCNKSYDDKRSEEEWNRLKKVADSVDVQSPLAMQMIDSALNASKDSLTYYDYYVEKGRFSLVKQPDSTLQCAQRIMQFAQKQPASPRTNGLLAEAHHLRANYYYLYHQNHDEVLTANKKAYDLFMESDMKYNVPNICANIGDVYMQQSLLPEAALWYRRAVMLTDSLQLSEEKGNTLYMGLGRIYCLLQDYKLSEEYYQKSAKDFDDMQVNMKIYFLNNYGNLQYYKHDFKSALAVYEKLDSLITKYGLKGSFEDYLCRLNMADVCLNLKQYKRSMDLLQHTDSFFRANEVGDAIYYANTIRIGNELNNGNTSKIKEILSGEPAGLTTDENMIDIRNTYLSDYYSRTGNLKQANYYAQIIRDRIDSIQLSREHMRASDILMRLTVDTLTLHNQLRLQERDAQLSQYKYNLTLVIGAAALLALMLIAWTMWLRKRNADKQLEIVQLKIANIRNSIAPHFIFNVLNHATRQEGAQQDKTIKDVIHLMHSQLNVTREPMVTLEEEIDFVKKYIAVAEATMGDDFTYSIKMPENPETAKMKVPSTFIQILVENSIKHGLKGLERPKHLSIIVEDDKNNITITVEDNGRGFDIRRTSSTPGTGTGLKVISRSIALYNQGHRDKINFSINNISNNDNDILGCRSTLTLPKTIGEIS